MRYRILPKAIRDFYEISADISLEDAEASDRVTSKLLRSVQLIAKNPGIGRPTAKRNTREWKVPNLPYLIPYRMRAGTVEILRFFSHQPPTTEIMVIDPS